MRSASQPAPMHQPLDIGRGAGPPKIAIEPRRLRRHNKSYTRFVTLMKVVLPSVAVMLIIAVVAWPHLQIKDRRFRLSFSSLQFELADAPGMLNPRFFGTDKRNRPFSITADVARTQLKDRATVELEMPKADISLEDGTWLVLTAQGGVYDRDGKALTLSGAVNLFHDSGYEFRTAAARVDLDEGVATGTDPVEGQGPFGDLQAEGFRLSNKGRTIYFTGKAQVILYPKAAELAR